LAFFLSDTFYIGIDEQFIILCFKRWPDFTS